MKNFCTFTPSNSSMRGVEPATQGGFFCVPAKGAFSTYKRRPAFTESGFGPDNARASGLLDSGIVRAAFLFAQNVQQSHHAHQQQALHAGNSGASRSRKADHSAPFNAGTGHHGQRFGAPASRVPRTTETTKQPAGKSASEAWIIRANNPLNCFIFINLRCRVAA